MALQQVTGYVSFEERLAFEEYAESLDLDVATLLRLLIVRELRSSRIALLRERFDTIQMPEKTKVTSHVKSDRIKVGITEIARAASLSTSRVCAILVRAELHECWLERAMKGMTQLESYKI